MEKTSDGVEARRLVTQYLSDILTFHCQSVERIIFGNAPILDDDPERILSNPDVSVLTFPFVHLKQVIIHSATYDFHQVERSLTYAVNYIGQAYLKEHVEVHIYGDLEKLHPNLQNSLTNLCKKMTVHEEHELLLPMSSRYKHKGIVLLPE